jgi:hypothetical protein
VSAPSLLDLAEAGKLPPRLPMALTADGLHTIPDLAGLTRKRLQTVPMVGPIGRQIVRNLLADHGYNAAHLAEGRVCH